MKQLLATVAALAFFATAAQACPFKMKTVEHDATMTTASILPADEASPQMTEPEDLKTYEPDFHEDTSAEDDKSE